MYLEDLKRWHWALVGMIAGLAVACAISLGGSTRDPLVRRPLSAERFVAIVNPPSGAASSIRNLVIDPPQDGYNFVTGEAVIDNAYRPFAIYAARPFVASPNVRTDSVLDYVQSLSTGDRQITYGYPWWRATWFSFVAAVVGGIVLIGGIWPTILNLIYFGGLRCPVPAEDAYDLERFVAETPIAQSKTHPSDEDQNRLHEIERQLESSLATTVPVSPSVDPLNEAAVVQLSGMTLNAPVPQSEEENKEYRGEFYPVEKPHDHHSPGRLGFALIELLVVIGIIAVLLSLLLPVIHRARQSANVGVCANNLRQISVALQGYLNDNQLMTFWRGKNINTDGMDWYGYGGRPNDNANHDPEDYFNRVNRPLNRYVSNNLDVFRCPCDDSAPWTHDITVTAWPAESQFDWVGNSYNFNANGYPLRPPPRHDGGLDGVRFSAITNTSQTIVFYEACLYWGADWHYAHKANIAFADGHVSFAPMPSQIGQLRWDP